MSRAGWSYQGEDKPLEPQLLSALVLATFATLDAPLTEAATLPAERADVPWHDLFARSRLDHAPGWDRAGYTARVRAWLASPAFRSLNASEATSILPAHVRVPQRASEQH